MMESKKISTSILQDFKIYFKKSFNSDDKNEILSHLKNFEEIKTDKINLIFFGMNSTGKTSCLNLILKYLMKNKIIDSDELIIIPTSESENTYFFTFIESSENNKYKIEINFNNNDKKHFQKNTYFKNYLKQNKIVGEFPNTKDGLNSINHFLENIFDISSNLLKIIRKNEISEINKNELRIPSKLIIKIPNFPKEYRLIDTPNFSLKIFMDDFLKILEELIYINLFILVQNIDSKTTYNNDREICQRISKEFFPAVFYSFYTKGETFLNNYKNINSKNSRDYEKSSRINKIFFDFIEDLSKDSNIIFRKIIAIIDNSYENYDVKNSIINFFDDLSNKLLPNLNKQEFINILIKNRLSIYFNKKLGNNEESIQKEIQEFSAAKKKALEECEKDFNKYFQDLGDYQNFKNHYPDYIYKLEDVFEKNETKVDHPFSRKNYVEKHTNFLIQIFLKIMLDRIESILSRILKSIYLNIKEIKCKIDFFEDYNLQDTNKLNKFQQFYNDNYNLYFNKTHLICSLAGVFSFFFFENSFLWSIIPTMSLISLPISIFRNYIGIWSKKQVQDDVFRGLFEKFIHNKNIFIQEAKRIISGKFDEIIEEYNKNLNSSKNAADLLKFLDKFKLNLSFENNINFEDMLTSINHEPLRNFINNSKNL